jgi:Bacterial SH3 domain
VKAVVLSLLCLCTLLTARRVIGSPLVRVSDASSDALSAALALFDGVTVTDCLNGNNSSRQDCVTMESAPSEVDRGIAVFGVSDAGQNGGFGAALGKTGDGDWKLWFTSQNPYQMTRLPGDMTVCSGGDGVNLRSGPSADAPSVGGYADGTVVTGEQFVLTEPVDPGHAGFGWFRISSPDSGWIYSKYLESAALNDNCALHNAQVSG